VQRAPVICPSQDLGSSQQTNAATDMTFGVSGHVSSKTITGQGYVSESSETGQAALFQHYVDNPCGWTSLSIFVIPLYVYMR
jgi:hypothetical protein